jgi:hypothetical protein
MTPGGDALAVSSAGRRDPGAQLPPPIKRIGVLRWLRDNLFSGWGNTLLSLSLLTLLGLGIPPLIRLGAAGQRVDGKRFCCL